MSTLYNICLLSIKSIQQLKWFPKWDFETTLRHTMNWYVAYHHGKSALELSLKDINTF